MIAALFVEKNGAYYGLDDVDPWPEERDARKYPGPYAVVAHPPCSRWCRLAGLVEARWGHKRGDDGGCFESALSSVRKWGGGNRASGLVGRVEQIPVAYSNSGHGLAARNVRRMVLSCRTRALWSPGKEGDLALCVQRRRATVSRLAYSRGPREYGRGLVVRQSHGQVRQASAHRQTRGKRNAASVQRSSFIASAFGGAT